MAIWKVSAERAEIFPHPNSDRMDLCKVGMFQLVVAKSNGYQTGDVIVFAPSRAVLPPDLRPHYTNSETGVSYLVGAEHDRVSGIRLRGELSEGITISLDYVLPKLGLKDAQELEIGADLAAALGISKYDPPLPAGFSGEVRRLDLDVPYRQHDVEQFGIFGGEFVSGEEVLATEKIHGSQANMLFGADGAIHVTSKGMASKGFEICEDQGNIYWRALRNCRLPELVAETCPGRTVQAFAEVYPAQGAAWSYGADGNRPLLRLFRLVVDGAEMPHHQVPSALRELWAPVLFEGAFEEATLRQLARGKEQVSGRELHIREGIVVTPRQPRPSREGWNLALKLISDKFKGSDEDPS
ncbi:RNA ligase [bacterium SCN 62-11]|nr:RNA ligase (ATP) [Candidatus Eremiobacteraeota bacterium]ODT62164.1 MAG: RNA ligase [bacterium SCN 62-11]